MPFSVCINKFCGYLHQLTLNSASYAAYHYVVSVQEPDELYWPYVRTDPKRFQR